MSKPILCFDFDGVIHSYKSGWKGPRTITDPPVPGAIEFMFEALAAGWDVVIHSSRSRYLLGTRAMRSWLRTHARTYWRDGALGPGLESVRFSRFKPPAKVTIDDRAITFAGKFPTLEALSEFKPWYNRKDHEEHAEDCIIGLGFARFLYELRKQKPASAAALRKALVLLMEE